jgi:hypothetical protein
MMGQSPSVEMRKYVGMDYLTLKSYISQRLIKGMTWNNYGSDWIVNHIVPLMCFDLTKEDDCKIAWSFYNLIPVFKRGMHQIECNFHFALRILEAMESCYIVDRLRAIAEKESHWGDEYLTEY